MPDFEMSYFVTLNFRLCYIHAWLLESYHSVYRIQKIRRISQNVFKGVFVPQRESNPQKAKYHLWVSGKFLVLFQRQPGHITEQAPDCFPPLVLQRRETCKGKWITLGWLHLISASD